MSPATMLLTLGGVTATALIAQVGLLAAGESASKEGAAKQVQSEPTRTGKERLGGKASDEQRVDNCKVPVDLRGTAPRPDSCDR